MVYWLSHLLRRFELLPRLSFSFLICYDLFAESLGGFWWYNWVYLWRKKEFMLRVHRPLHCLVEGDLVPASKSSSNMMMKKSRLEIKDGIGWNWVASSRHGVLSIFSGWTESPWAWNFSRTIIGLIAAGESRKGHRDLAIGLGVSYFSNKIIKHILDYITALFLHMYSILSPMYMYVECIYIYIYI